jgi:hypothetical protein
MPPKQALVSPWTERYLFQGSRNDHPFVFTQVSASRWGHFAEVGGIASKSCFTRRLFGGMNWPLPRATKKAFASHDSISSPLPFMKGGWGGFLGLLFHIQVV